MAVALQVIPSHELPCGLIRPEARGVVGRRSISVVLITVILSTTVFSHLLSTIYALPAQLAVLVSPLYLALSLVMFRRLPFFALLPTLYAVFLFWLLIAVFSPALSGNMGHMLQAGVYFFMPLYLLLIGYHAPRGLVWLVFGVAICASAAFVVLEKGVLFFSLGMPSILDLSEELRAFGRDPDVVVHFARATGLLGNPNEFGFFACGSIFAIWFLSEHKQRGVGVAIPMLGAVLSAILSGSRGSIIAFALSAFLFLMVRKSVKGFLFAATVALMFSITVALVIGTLPPAMVEQWDTRFSALASISEDRNLAGRFAFWDSFFASQYVLFGTIVSPELVFGHAIDNLFVRWWAQAGFIGFVTVVYVFVLLAYMATGLADPGRRALALAFLLFVFINSQTMLSFLSPSGAALFWVMAGQIIRSSRVER